MNATKVMLKAIVLTALMQTVQSKGRAPTDEERRVVDGFNEELLAYEETQEALDKDVDEVYLDLLEAIDCIVELPRIALA
jgi:hypothetical protein